VLQYSGNFQFLICNLPFGKLKALSLSKGDFQIVNRQSKMKDGNTTKQHNGSTKTNHLPVASHAFTQIRSLNPVKGEIHSLPRLAKSCLSDVPRSMRYAAKASNRGP
jgi:hypothetical protein